MKTLVALALVSLTVLCGCRRQDIREMTVSIPTLSEENRPKIVEALQKYAGIDKNSYRWDMTAKTLTLKYDSMQLAEANVSYAICEKGINASTSKLTRSAEAPAR